MSVKLKNILMNSSSLSEVRGDLSKEQWEGGVKRTLQELYLVPPNLTSRIVIETIENSNWTVTIIPEKPPIRQLNNANAAANPVSQENALMRGERMVVGGAGTAQLISGTGKGSDVVLNFTAQDWEASTRAASTRAADETLLHELVHALRQVLGLEVGTMRDDEREKKFGNQLHVNPPFKSQQKGMGSEVELMSGQTKSKVGRHSQIYNHFEEFVAIVITNVYRSENERAGLRRDHVSDDELAYPMTNARNFLTVWRPQLEAIFQQMPAISIQLSTVKAHFNPFFELFERKIRNAQGLAPAP